MEIDFDWSVEGGEIWKGRHFENEQLFKFTFSNQLLLAKFSVCLVSESNKSSTLTEKMLGSPAIS